MKKMKKLVVVFFCAFFLTGCYKINVNIKIDKNLKGSADMEILMKKELASKEDLDYFKNNSMDGFKVVDKNVKKTIDGDEYLGIKLEAEESLDAFEEIVENKDGQLVLTLDMSSLSDDLLSQQLGESEDVDMSTLKAMDVEFNLNFELPGKVIKAKGGEINRNNVTFDMLDFDEKEIIITFEKGSDTFTILIFGGVIIALGAIGFAVWKMRKSKKEVEAASQEDVQENVQEDKPEELVVNEAPVTSEEVSEEKTTTQNTTESKED